MSTALSPLQLGWATADVTPPEPVFLRGQMHARVSNSVHDPLTVTALALTAGAESVILVSCDRVCIEAPIRESLLQRLPAALPELDPRRVILNATHTHSAPEVQAGAWPTPPEPVMDGDRYLPIFVDGVLDAVTRAWATRAPGAVSWARSHAAVGVNRRTRYLDDSARMYGPVDDPVFAGLEGGEDSSVDLLFTWSPTGELTGVLINQSCPSQVTEGTLFVSADFWHETRVELRRRFGADLFVAGQCAPAGDLSPHPLLYQKAEARMRELRGVTEREELALRLADAVERVLPLAKQDLRTAPVLRYERLDVGLTRRRITADELAEAMASQAAEQATYERLRDAGSDDYVALSGAFGRAKWYGRAQERSEVQHLQYPVELHLVRLGDIAFATNPFELFLDYGLRIEARSPAVQTFCVQLVGEGTYLPTARAVAGKSYGAGAPSNVVGPEGGQELVEATLAGLGRLFATD